MKPIRNLAFLLACLSGFLLLAAALVTMTSIVGRNFLSTSLDGDTELVAALTGSAVACFLPWCQLTKGNIIVDFFTSQASPATQRMLDRVGAALLSLVMAALAYRTVLGTLSAWKSGAGSMILGLPDWAIQCAFVPALMLTALIAALQALSIIETAEVQP